jgi:hypothetical protein
MFGLFGKYYYDVTKYNIIFSTVAAILTEHLITGIVSFGTIGIFISLLVYKQFNDVEYYFYLNGGLSKKEMIFKLAIINLIIGLISTILIVYIL